MSIFIRHEPKGFREYPSKKAQKAPEPLVNVMPVIVLRCACGRLWSNEACLTAHVARGCAAPEEQK